MGSLEGRGSDVVSEVVILQVLFYLVLSSIFQRHLIEQ